MRLNKFQKAWIAKLKSGKSRKFKGALRDPERGAYCCLGVACKLAEDTISLYDLDLSNHNLVKNGLKLSSDQGDINIDKVKPEWLYLFEYVNSSIIKFDNRRTLAELNDHGQVSHKKIGEFIDANRNAVFKS